MSARVGYYISRSISIEGSVRYARPELSVDLSGDAESAADVTATEIASHYVFGGSVLFDLRGASFAGGRGVPFVSGGAGYLRELHEGNLLVETGIEYHATAGLKYWFGSGDNRFGLRVEGGMSAREEASTTKTAAGYSRSSPRASGTFSDYGLRSPRQLALLRDDRPSLDSIEGDGASCPIRTALPVERDGHSAPVIQARTVQVAAEDGKRLRPFDCRPESFSIPFIHIHRHSDADASEARQPA